MQLTGNTLDAANQRNRLVSTAAWSKSKDNGFSFEDHFATVANIDRLFENRTLVEFPASCYSPIVKFIVPSPRTAINCRLHHPKKDKKTQISAN